MVRPRPERATSSREALREQENRGRRFLAVYATVVGIASLGFVALAVFVHDQDLIPNFDAPVARAIQAVSWPPAAWALTHMSDIGWSPLDVVCVTVIAATLWLLRLRIEALVIVVVTLVAGEAGTISKDLVQRARPTSNFVHLAAHLADYSFPSGHVIFATVLFGTTFFVVWVVWSRSAVRDSVLALLAVPVLLMGPSRIYLGEHWPSDVLGAYCFGAVWVALAVELILVLKSRLALSLQGRPHRRRWTPLI